MLVTGGVRVALDRLARGDRRDGSGLTGSVARGMGRGLATRASRGRRNVGRRTTRLITGAMGATLRRRCRGRRTYRDPSRTTSRGIASPMRRDLRRKAGRRGRNVLGRAGWVLTSLMRGELRGRTSRGHIRWVPMRDITRRMGWEPRRRARGGRRDASRRTVRRITRTVSGARGRRVNRSRTRGSRACGVTSGSLASRMRRHCRRRSSWSRARWTSSGRARGQVARYVGRQRGRSRARREPSRVATNAGREGRNSPDRSGGSYK